MNAVHKHTEIDCLSSKIVSESRFDLRNKITHTRVTVVFTLVAEVVERNTPRRRRARKTAQFSNIFYKKF